MRISLDLPLNKLILLGFPLILMSFTLFFISDISRFVYKNFLRSKIHVPYKKVKSLRELDVSKYTFVLKDQPESVKEVANLFTLIPYDPNKVIFNLKSPVKKQKKKPPNYKIDMIYIGVSKRYVVIGGKLFTEGDKISENEYIVKIFKDKVLLDGAWGKRWLRYY